MKLRFLVFILASYLALPALAEEAILRFHSDIQVQVNGDLLVTETIRVRAEGRNIRRGIYRDFPTLYQRADGSDFLVGFELLGVTRDGQPENYKIQRQNNGLRIYLGDESIYLSKGEYEYQIQYLTSRQLGFFTQFDELYWNVTGNGWSFPIEQASARVILPQAVVDYKLNGYTGPQGSKLQQLRTGRESGTRFYFETTGRLAAQEGLTIVAAWSKGVINPPSTEQLRDWFIQDHLASIVALASAALLLLYYGLTWLKLGRDPRAGVVVPLYDAPEGYSPASMRFVTNMGYDKKCFSAAIINLAAKGALTITEQKDGEFKLEKNSLANIALAPGETAIYDSLMLRRQSLSITQAEHSSLASAIAKHRSSLQRDYEKLYFVTNRRYLLPGLLLTLLGGGYALYSMPSQGQTLATLMLGILCVIPILSILIALRRLKRGGKFRALHFVLQFAAVVLIVTTVIQTGFIFELFKSEISWPVITSLTAMLSMNYFFHHWLKAPTLAGRKLLDSIEGFKHYLEVAEEDELALRDAPKFSTALYEKLLPYAIALDLENPWTARLNRAIEQGAVEASYQQPHWFRSHSFSQQHFSQSLSSSLNSAISSSSVAPGSSSGSSGGSSGGGGSGGGGGGW